MTLKEKILEILHNHFSFATNKASDEITALIERDYYEKEFVKWNNITDCHTNEAYKFWTKHVKETKDTITTHDLKSIGQASDEYYERDKLFERKK